MLILAFVQYSLHRYVVGPSLPLAQIKGGESHSIIEHTYSQTCNF